MKITYKIDSHVHTCESSNCGFISGENLVEKYHYLGYDAIVITDHLNDEYFISLLECKDNWNACVDALLLGYENAKARGDQIGLDVILGMEIRFTNPDDSDYLIYGFDENFLRANPYLHRSNPQEFFEKFGDTLLIIHAHPFRNMNETVFTKYIHGIEVFNGHPNHNSRNDKALALSKLHPEFCLLSASDTHHDGDEGRAWMLFEKPVTNSYEFRDAVKLGKYTLGHI